MINPELIKAMIFDLGRVLIRVDFTAGLFKYYQKSEESSDEEILQELFKDKIFIGFNTGKIDAQQVYQSIQDKYGLDLSYDKFTSEWCNIFAPMPGMRSIVERVSKKFILGLLSDIDPLHWQFCQKNFPVLKNFIKPALSYQIGALKPDPLCYQRAAEYVGTQAKYCLFIDDREINVQGARDAGMQAIQFTGVADLERLLSDLGI
jgi:putative hydrolase of the HAD superfamily